MKRKALLIGNSNGLPGVKKDIANWFSFLTSDIGGAWYPSEIEIKMNPGKNELMDLIKRMKGFYDFIIVVYSGHGAYSKGTILEINEHEEYIYESDLKGIASRQISVFDCCRGLLSDERSINESIRIFNQRKIANFVRDYYDRRIMQSVEQQISLYACSIGESAYDSSDGGYYTKNLLRFAKDIGGERYLTTSIIHQEAALKTTSEVFEKEKAIQKPDATLPRCVSCQQLILSINPIIR